MERLSSSKCYGGEQIRCKHFSTSLLCEMTFSVFLPEQLSTGVAVKLPVLYWLSGLTCTDENFVQKAGAQKLASELGLILVAPDTSPRGEGVPDDPEAAYDFGHGAAYYVNATQQPWKKHYQMYDYVVEELPELINRKFPANGDRQGISGHSMGGHGALTIGLRNPGKYKSISAFAPIVSPLNCPWGQKALGNYLGEDKNAWLNHDAVSLVKKATQAVPILVDQGTADEFLETQLKPSLLVEACSQVGYPLNYNQRDGYDHSYFFVSSFMDNHLRFHSALLSVP